VRASVRQQITCRGARGGGARVGGTEPQQQPQPRQHGGAAAAALLHGAGRGGDRPLRRTAHRDTDRLDAPGWRQGCDQAEGRVHLDGFDAPLLELGVITR